MDTADLKLEKDKQKFEKDRADAFKVMMQTPGWMMYVDLLNTHIKDRTKNLFAPTKPGEECLEQHNKGAVYGLLLARDLPSATVMATLEATPAGGEDE